MMARSYDAAHEGRLRRWDHLTSSRAQIARLSREEIIDLLSWNDPNGSYRDEDNEYPLTLDEARELLWETAESNRPVGGGKRKRTRRAVVEVTTDGGVTRRVTPRIILDDGCVPSHLQPPELTLAELEDKRERVLRRAGGKRKQVAVTEAQFKRALKARRMGAR